MQPYLFRPQASIVRRIMVGAAALLTLAASSVFAQYPDKAIRMIVPYPPGGATDVIGRVMAQKLTAALGQTVVVDNRAGAAGGLGAAMVAKEKPDGYTLLMGALTRHSISSVLSPATAQFDMEKSFSPVAIVGRVPLVFVVNPTVKANTLTELITLAKANPGSITYASSGNGSPQHLAGEMFQRLVGVKLLHVPYKGSSPAMTDLIGGQVQMMIETAPSAQGHIKAGKLRVLATATSAPIPSLPGVPTAPEAGLKGFDVSSMFGILAPAGTPAPIIAKLNATLKGILEQQDVKDSMLAQGANATFTTPEQATHAIRTEVAMWTQVIKDGNIKGD